MSDDVRPSPSMSDPVRHTMALPELEAEVARAGIVMSRRQLMRHCASQVFDAQKFPAANNVDTWFVAPHSIAKGIADLKALQDYRLRRSPTQSDDVRHSPTPRAMSELEESYDRAGHSPTMSDIDGPEKSNNSTSTESDEVRHSPTVSGVIPSVGQGSRDLDIYDHPYVRRLETQIEKLELKYEAQVRRTEEIQIANQHQLIELQRMTTIGQSQTLAEFMLKAKNFF